MEIPYILKETLKESPRNPPSFQGRVSGTEVPALQVVSPEEAMQRLMQAAGPGAGGGELSGRGPT